MKFPNFFLNLHFFPFTVLMPSLSVPSLFRPVIHVFEKYLFGLLLLRQLYYTGVVKSRFTFIRMENNTIINNETRINCFVY